MVAKRAFSVNYLGFKFDDSNYLMKLEKVIALFIKRKGSHDELKEFGSPLHPFVGTFITEETLKDIEEACKHSVSIWCKEFSEEVEIEIKQTDTHSFKVRVAIEEKYLDLDSSALT